MSKKPELYNDLHPEKSLKGTGFKNKEVAEKTIKLVSKRSIKYQFDVINTMYNRAKYHPHQTNDMKEVIKVFNIWLKNYTKLRDFEKKYYRFLPLSEVLKYEKIAKLYEVSEVTRGVKKGTRVDKGFLEVYKDVKGDKNKLQYIPIKSGKPSGQDYWSYRISFINSRLAQIKKAKTPLYYTEGKFKYLPTKQHIVLIMHGYSPDKRMYD